MSLAIDLREPLKQRNKVRNTFELAEILVVTDVLSSSDYRMLTPCHMVGVERKTADDLINSFFTKGGRLVKQLLTMVGEHTVSILLIEGRLWCNDMGMVETRYGESSIRWNSLTGLLRSVQAMGITVEFCPNPHYLARQLYDIYKYYSNPTHKSMALRDEMKALGDPRIMVLSALPDVGPKKARAILDHYVHLNDALTAYLGWNLQVDGIGPKTVEKVKEVMER